MIYVTGDTHIPIDSGKLDEWHFPEQYELTKEDYLIICGDFGGVWNRDPKRAKHLDRLDDASFTTLWLDGNHENFGLLAEYPVDMWNGGKVQFIRPSVIHLMRGQVFTLVGTTFFAMGGGYSIDKEWRKPGKSWWPEDMPSEEEYAEGWANLAKHDNKVDYIVTHTAPTSIVQKYYHAGVNHEIRLNDFLEEVDKTVQYEHWYCGHIHTDEVFDANHTLLFQKIVQII